MAPRIENKLQSMDVAFDSIELHPNLKNVRTGLGDVDALAKSIRVSGLQSPLTGVVYTDGDGDDAVEHTILVAGQRRFAALTAIREKSKGRNKPFEEVPFRLAKAEDEDDALLQARFLMLTENLQRENPDIGEVIRTVGEFMDDNGLSESEIAKRLGKPLRWVKGIARARKEASPKLTTAVEKGTCSLTNAFRILEASKDAAAQDKLLDKASAAGDAAKKAGKSKRQQQAAKKGAIRDGSGKSKVTIRSMKTYLREMSGANQADKLKLVPKPLIDNASSKAAAALAGIQVGMFLATMALAGEPGSDNKPLIDMTGPIPVERRPQGSSNAKTAADNTKPKQTRQSKPKLTGKAAEKAAKKAGKANK